MVFNATFGLKLFHVVNGSWGWSLKEVQYNISAGDYILRASYRQGLMQASLMSTADPPVLLTSFDYDISPNFGSGCSGIYSGYNAMQFDDFQAFATAALDPQVAQDLGLGDGSLVGSDDLEVLMGTQAPGAPDAASQPVACAPGSDHIPTREVETQAARHKRPDAVWRGA